MIFDPYKPVRLRMGCYAVIEKFVVDEFPLEGYYYSQDEKIPMGWKVNGRAFPDDGDSPLDLVNIELEGLAKYTVNRSPAEVEQFNNDVQDNFPTPSISDILDNMESDEYLEKYKDCRSISVLNFYDDGSVSRHFTINEAKAEERRVLINSDRQTKLEKRIKVVF